MKCLNFFLSTIRKVSFMMMGIISQQSASKEIIVIPSPAEPKKETKNFSFFDKLKHTGEMLCYGFAMCIVLGFGATIMF